MKDCSLAVEIQTEKSSLKAIHPQLLPVSCPDSSSFKLSWLEKLFVNVYPLLSLASGILYQVTQEGVIMHVRKHLLMHIFKKVNEWKVEEWREEGGYINDAVDPTRPTAELSRVTPDHTGCVLHRGTGQREPLCSLGL